MKETLEREVPDGAGLTWDGNAFGIKAAGRPQEEIVIVPELWEKFTTRLINRGMKLQEKVESTGAIGHHRTRRLLGPQCFDEDEDGLFVYVHYLPRPVPTFLVTQAEAAIAVRAEQLFDFVAELNMAALSLLLIAVGE